MVRIAVLLPVLVLGAAEHHEGQGGTCSADTSGTCKYFACNKARRGAVCDTSTSKCLCPQGTCSSKEGICVPQEATCNANTGGSCKVFGCNDYRRGATCNT